jgi:hypothetical protein
MGELYSVTSKQTLENFISRARTIAENHAQVSFQIHLGRRSSRQSRALHLLFERIADCLFAYGLNLSVNCSVFKQPLERAWKAEDVKKLIWHPVMQAMTDKTSTTQLTGQEIDDIYGAIQERFFLKDITLPEFPREDITYGHQKG